MGLGEAFGSAVFEWERKEKARQARERKRIMSDDYKSPINSNPEYGGRDMRYTQNNSDDLYPEGSTWIDRLKLNEGFKDKVYKDSRGFDTIGFGHKLTDLDKVSGIYNNGIDEDAATKLLENDYGAHKAKVRDVVPNIDKYPQHIQEVLYDMGYNLGPTGLAEFKNMLGALDTGDYMTGAKELMNSRYAEQTGSRARRNANHLLQGMGTLDVL